MLEKIFKAYDIRGTYPSPLNEAGAWRIGLGCGRFLLAQAEKEGVKGAAARRLVVGRDMRTSSPSLRDALVRGLRDAGAQVVDIGMVDTPAVYFAINHLDAAGGVQVTASHNPPQYNGFKISRRHAKPVGEATGLKDILRLALEADESKKGAGAGTAEARDLWDAYRAHVLRFADLKGKRVRIAVDASNGMAGTMAPAVFGAAGSRVAGLEIVEVNFENSKGVFVHEPNPLVAANLRDTQRAVVDSKADFGVCFDGDADRLVVVDEKGAAVGCDHLTAFLGAWFIRRHGPSPVIYDLRSSKALEEDIRRAGGEPVRSRVGHVFMKGLLAERGAVFGGELSGHFYFRDNFSADSGAIALAVVLSAFAERGERMSRVIAPIARYAQSGEMNFEVEDKDGALERLRGKYGARGRVDELDGVTIDCFEREGWWCNVRKSNTEPLLRLNLEARDRATLDRMTAEIAPMLGRAVEH
ncbi:MAG TPA: phosphomannomutase/phosphoglucomutase [Phycisphaerales bacterium]|nr:phosphomannomutase/phosphoglucomutase [Phycisphaerales bacterium]